MIWIIVILHSSKSFWVIDVDVSLWWNVVELKIFSVNLIAAIIWDIIGEDQEVIRVVLIENWIKVVLYPKISIIFVAWGYNAHWKFCTDFL